MATYREIVYMCLDEIGKLNADDAYFTEEHIIFLADKMRALLLLRKYHNAKKYKSSTSVSDSDYQLVCFDLEKTELIPGICDTGTWLKTTEQMPKTLDIGTTTVYSTQYFLSERITFIPAERMLYVGHNKWLKNILYVAQGPDGYLYLYSNNPQFLYLAGEDKLQVKAVFEDADEAAALTCDSEGNYCDVLDAEFPLEAGLISSCIELVVQELTGTRYAPQDKGNNAKDDLSEAAVTSSRAPSAARSTVPYDYGRTSSVNES